MNRDGWLPWFLLGCLVGLLIGMWLTRDQQSPPPPGTEPAAQPRPKAGGNVMPLDFRNEGMDQKATGTHGR